jgi:hypothetical protein
MFPQAGERVAHGHNKGCREIIKEGLVQREISALRERKKLCPTAPGRRDSSAKNGAIIERWP